MPRLRSKVGDVFSPYFRVKFFANERLAQVFSAQRQRAGTSDEVTRNLFLRTGGISRTSQRDPFARKVPSGPALSPLIATSQLFSAAVQQNKLDAVSLENYVSELKLELLGTDACTLEMTLTPPYEDAVAIIDSNIIRFDTLVLVEFGYAEHGTPTSIAGPYLFRISLPGATFGDDITITVKGHDILSASALGRQTARKWLRKEYPTNFAIIEAVAKSLGLDVELPEAMKKAGQATTNTIPLFAKQTDDLEQSTNDWLFLTGLVAANFGHFYTRGMTLVLYDDKTRIQEEGAAYRLLYRANPITPYDVPLESFDASYGQEIFTVLTKDRVRLHQEDKDLGVGMQASVDVNPKAVPNQAAIGSTTTAGQGLTDDKATQTPIGVATGRPIGVDGASFNLSAPSGDKMAKGKASTLAMEGLIGRGIQATARMPGLPFIEPDNLVLVDGVPKYFRGTYTVRKVTHTIGEGFTTEVSLTRHSPGLLPVPGAEDIQMPTKEATKATAPNIAPKQVEQPNGRKRRAL